MLEPGVELGAGIAYRTAEPVHVLNSRAATMSAHADDPGHFASWSGRPVGPTGFAARRDYGRYLYETLDAVAANEPGRFTQLRARATALRLGGDVELATDTARAVRADRVVLALGHAGPAHPTPVDAAVRRHPRYVADPWRTDALDAVPLDSPVLLVGTGLTAVDVALTLAARAAGAGVRGVAPRPAAPGPPRRPAGDDPGVPGRDRAQSPDRPVPRGVPDRRLARRRGRLPPAGQRPVAGVDTRPSNGAFCATSRGTG